MQQPTARQIADMLHLSLTGELLREEVALWALDYINRDDWAISDWRAWDLLLLAAGADMKDPAVGPPGYVFDDDTVRQWIRDARARETGTHLFLVPTPQRITPLSAEL